MTIESLPAEEFCTTFDVGSWDHSWDDERRFIEEDHQDYLDALANDVQAHGFTYPVTVVNDTVMNGHHRVIVALMLGMDVPFVRGFQPQDYHGAEGNKWTPSRHFVIASQADSQPHPDVMASSAQSAAPEAGRDADAPGPYPSSASTPDRT